MKFNIIILILSLALIIVSCRIKEIVYYSENIVKDDSDTSGKLKKNDSINFSKFDVFDSTKYHIRNIIFYRISPFDKIKIYSDSGLIYKKKLFRFKKCFLVSINIESDYFYVKVKKDSIIIPLRVKSNVLSLQIEKDLFSDKVYIMGTNLLPSCGRQSDAGRLSKYSGLHPLHKVEWESKFDTTRIEK
jgi:hypothetical protein